MQLGFRERNGYMKYKGAVFFDYDGTLADDRCGIHLPTETTRKALKSLSENGYMVVLNSGRSKASVLDTGINFDGYVLMNGSYAEVDGECVFEKVIEREKLSELLSVLNSIDVDYFLETDNLAEVKDVKGRKFIEYMDKYELDYDNFPQMNTDNLPKVYKIQVIYGEAENFEELKKKLPEGFVIDDHRNGISTDVSQKGIAKSTGVEKICEYFNIPKENTYAFGDNTNDYDMIKYVGHGIVMGNHAPELDEVAEMVTDTVENEGIYKALIKYGLINS